MDALMDTSTADIATFETRATQVPFSAGYWSLTEWQMY